MMDKNSLGQPSDVSVSTVLEEKGRVVKVPVIIPGYIRNKLISIADKLLGISKYYRLVPIVNPDKIGEVVQVTSKFIPQSESIKVNLNTQAGRDKLALYTTYEVNGLGTFRGQYDLGKGIVVYNFIWVKRTIKDYVEKNRPDTEELRKILKHSERLTHE